MSMYVQVSPRRARGIFLTTEALLSLLLALLIIALLPMPSRGLSQIYDYYLLSDTFSVLHRGYKSQLSLFLDSGIDAGIGDAISFISSYSGREIFISSGNHRIGTQCTPRTTVERIVVAWLPSSRNLFVKRLILGVCK